MATNRILRCMACNFLASYPEDATELYSICPICGHEGDGLKQSWVARVGGNPVGCLAISRQRRV